MSGAERIEIDLARQELVLWRGRARAAHYPVSTARNGPGERIDSECTPRGAHTISAKIGAGCPPNTVFVGRRPTGEIYDETLAAAAPGRDWILTRILWLAGCEPGRNAGGDRDTLARYIYIHGTPDSIPLGRPGSRGCIRMRNADVVDLFEQVTVGTPVDIRD